MSYPLSARDAASIRKAIVALPNIDRRIVEIVAISREEVEVTTGFVVPGVEVGGGNRIRVAKKEGRWIADIDGITNWIS